MSHCTGPDGMTGRAWGTEGRNTGSGGAGAGLGDSPEATGKAMNPAKSIMLQRIETP